MHLALCASCVIGHVHDCVQKRAGTPSLSGSRRGGVTRTSPWSTGWWSWTPSGAMVSWSGTRGSLCCKRCHLLTLVRYRRARWPTSGVWSLLAVRGRLDGAKMEFNRLVNQIKELRKAKQDATELQEASKAMKGGIKELEDREKELQESRDAALLPLGNLVHDSVPVSDNEVIMTVGQRKGGWEGEEDSIFLQCSCQGMKLNTHRINHRMRRHSARADTH